MTKGLKLVWLICLVMVIVSLPIAAYIVFDINEICIPAVSLFAIVYCLSFCIFVLLGVFNFKGKYRSAVLIFLSIVVFCTFILPQTEFGMQLNFSLLRSSREKTVMMYQTDMLSQSGPYEYIPSFRLESQTGRIYATEDGKIEFTLYHGLDKSVKLIYM
ncbi:MAG: hypothetical protein IJN48_04515 [Clostridia bacterium]|nr:hypothetical protein [Clostridia bacterium]